MCHHGKCCASLIENRTRLIDEYNCTEEEQVQEQVIWMIFKERKTPKKYKLPHNKR